MSDLTQDRDAYDLLVAHDTGGYSWSEVQLLRHKESGQLVYGQNEGCSCTWFWDGPTLEPVNSWQEAVEKAKVYWADESYVWDPADAVRFAEKVQLAAQAGRL